MADLPFIPYTRVSRVGKRRNDLLASHDDQTRVIDTLGAREGLPLLDDASFRDEDRSANDFNRENFVRALELVRTGRAAGIVVATLDRFSRDVFAGAEMLKLIGQYGGKLYADDAGGLIDLDDDESLIFYIMRGTMATLEHRRKARGLAASVARSIKGGRHLAPTFGYMRPDGFHTVTIDGESFKVRYPIEPNPDEVPAVVRAYEMRGDEDASWQTIADALNREHPLSNGKRWTWGRVRAMVKSETYLGIAHSGEHRTPNAHEPIVDRALWERANRPKRGPRHDAERERRVLSGVLYCGSCGYRMRPTTSNGRRYYKCKRRHVAGVCEAPVNLPADEAEAYMIGALRSYIAERLYHGSPDGANVAEAERAYDAALEAVRAAAPSYMTRHTLADDVREIVEDEWSRVNATLDRTRDELARATADATGLADLPSDLKGADLGELSAEELRSLITAAFPVIFARRAEGWRETVADRLRPLWRSQAPAEIVEGRRERPLRTYFAAEAA